MTTTPVRPIPLPGFWQRVRTFFGIGTRRPPKTRVAPLATATGRVAGRVEWDDPTPPALGIPRWDLIVDFGTSATVMLATRPEVFGAEWRFILRELDAQEFPELLQSDYLSDGRRFDSVVEVGVSALLRWQREEAQPGGEYLEYRLSLKRLIELRSRRSAVEMNNLTAMVAGYLLRALRHHSDSVSQLPAHANDNDRDDCLRRELPVTDDSHVTISVPNSFNETATAVVRNGVSRAIQDVWEVEIPLHQVHVVREGAAAAQLAFGAAMEQGHLTRFPADAMPVWKTVGVNGDVSEAAVSMLQPPPAGQATVVAVLDIGAGTTDLTLIESRTSTGDQTSWSVLMNAGVPLGGDDIDRVILGAILSNPQRVGKGASNRYVAMSMARQAKERRKPNQPFTLSATEAKDIVRAIEGESELNDPATITETFRTQASLVAELAVRGLFSLLPSPEQAQISAILLTGRGSLLQEIRSAVVAEAQRLECSTVRTLANAAQSKLAVAFGCGLLRDVAPDALSRRLAARTLGRVLVVQRANGGPIAEIGAFTPVPAPQPICIRIPLPSTLSGRFLVSERRIVLDERQAKEMSQRGLLAKLGDMGLYRVLADYEVGNAAGIGRELLVMFDAEEGQFLTAFNRGSLVLHAPVPPAGTDVISGLPLPFPEA